jgi:lysophospholipase L1-like esterase
VFVVYVAAATLWIRGQHQASVDAVVQGKDSLRPWTFPYRTSGLVAGVGFALAVAGAALDNSTALLSGALATYFGLGYLLMRFRTYTGDGCRSRVNWGAGLLVAVVVLSVGGLLALEATTKAAFLIASVLFAPIGLSLLAEPAIRALQGPRRKDVRAAALIGVVLFAADVGIAVARVDTAWVGYAFVALALLVAAVVSSTQADIAIVIAAVALMGFTSMSEDKPDALRPQAGQQNVLVALGDSYMSGEGADVFYDEDDLEPANHCNRAPTAWAAMAGRTTRLFDSVAFLACSGARTFNVRHVVPTSAGVRPNKPQFNEPGTQLDQVRALKKRLGGKLDPSLVVVGLGGNDAGFSTIGMMCLAPGDCSEKRALFEDNLPDVGKALAATYDEIRREFPAAPVLVTAYPAPIYTENGKPESCDGVALSRKDMEFIRDFVTKLNATVQQAAASKRFYFLGDMEHALADSHLQLCDEENGKRPGINFIGLRSVGGIAEQRFNPVNWYHNSLHPNERGHAAMLQVFEQWRATHPNPPRDAPGSATDVPGGANGAPGGANVAPEPPCDLVGGGPSTTVRCVDKGAAWARGQLADTLLWPGVWGLQIAVATLAAWLLAVALFGCRKPWWPRP